MNILFRHTKGDVAAALEQGRDDKTSSTSVICSVEPTCHTADGGAEGFSVSQESKGEVTVFRLSQAPLERTYDIFEDVSGGHYVLARKQPSTETLVFVASGADTSSVLGALNTHVEAMRRELERETSLVIMAWADEKKGPWVWEPPSFPSQRQYTDARSAVWVALPDSVRLTDHGDWGLTIDHIDHVVTRTRH